MYSLYYLTSELDNMRPRYIGYTSRTINKRLKEHINDKKKTHKTNWINHVIENNTKVEIFLIEETDTLVNATLLEKKLISENITNLTNSTMGGEFSKVLLDDVKNKISQSLKEYFKINGKPIGHNKGMVTSEETKQLLREKISKYKLFTYEELYDLYVTKRYSIKK